MTLSDAIRRDKEEGTDGPIEVLRDSDWYLETDGENTFSVIGANNSPIAVVAVESAFGLDFKLDANIRRFTRLPHLEDAILAAEGMAEALDLLLAETSPAAIRNGQAKLSTYRAAVKKMEG